MASLLKLIARSLRKGWRGQSSAAKPHGAIDVDLEFSRLEPRRVLSADFALGTTLLNLHGFTGTANQNLSITENGIFRDFTLQEGTWTNVGGALGGIVGAGTSTLSVPTTLLDTLADGLLIDDSHVVGLNVQIDDLDVAGNLTLQVGSLELGSLKVDGDLSATVSRSISDTADALIDIGGKATLVSGALAADFNSDGIVDGEDLGIWQENYGANGVTRELGDADGSGTVNGRDFLIWQRQFQPMSDMTSTIQLADGEKDQLNVVGNLTVQTIGGQSIDVGVTATGAAAAAQVTLGSVSFATTASGSVRVAEDFTAAEPEALRGMQLSGASYAGSVYLRSAAGITQDSASSLEANSLAVRAGAGINLLGQNSVEKFAAQAGGTLSLRTESSFEIASLMVGSDPTEGVVRGIDVGANSAILRVTEVVPSLTESVTQSAPITAESLLLRGNDSYILLHDQNKIGVSGTIGILAADNEGDIQLREQDGFAIGTVQDVDEVRGVQIGDHLFSLEVGGPISQTSVGKIVAKELSLGGAGEYKLATADNDIAVFTADTTNNIYFKDGDTGFEIDGAKIMGEFTLGFNSTGPVTQTAEIAVRNLVLEGSGSYTLTHAQNDVTRLAAKTTASVYYRDQNGFNITTLKADNGNDVVGIDVGDMSTLGLRAGGAVTQDARIFAGSLLLQGAGPYRLVLEDSLAQPVNNVSTLAVATTGDVYYTDASGIVIGRVQDSAGTEFAGANVGNRTLGLEAGGEVTQAADEASKDPARIVAGSLLLQGPGPHRLVHEENNITTLAVKTTGDVFYRDASGFQIGRVLNAVGDEIAGANVGTRTLGLSAGDEVTQATDQATKDPARIVAGALLLQGTGPYHLAHKDNEIDTLAVKTTSDVFYRDDSGFVIGRVQDAAGIEFAGADVGDRTLALEAGGDVTQALDEVDKGQAKIIADRLLLQGSGKYTLTHEDNDARILAANTQASITYTDADTLTIGEVNGVKGLKIEDKDASDDHTLQLTVLAGDIKQSASCPIDVDVTNADFAVAGGASIHLNDLDVPLTGSLGPTQNQFMNDSLATKREANLSFTALSEKIADLTIFDASNVEIPALDITGNLVVAGAKITDSATVAVGRQARFHATGTEPGMFVIDLDGLNVGIGDMSGIAVGTLDGNVRIVNDQGIRFLSGIESDIKGSLEATAKTGDIKNVGGRLKVTGEAQLSAASEIDLDTQIVGKIGLDSGGKADISNLGTIEFKTTEVDGNLDATSEEGDILNATQNVTVFGEGQFAATKGKIDLRTDITGVIGLTSQNDAKLINTKTINFKNTLVTNGNLEATATLGDITNTAGSVTVQRTVLNDQTRGQAQFTAAAGMIDLSTDITGVIGLTSQNDAKLINTKTINFKNTLVTNGNLEATATTGDITNTAGSVTVQRTNPNDQTRGQAQFTAAAGMIDLSTDITGVIGLTSQNDATLINTKTINFKNTLVTNGNLEATATTGDITDRTATSIEVARDATFKTRDNIRLADENDPNNRLLVGGHATFESVENGNIEVGMRSVAAASAETRFGRVTFVTGDGVTQGGHVQIAEDIAGGEANATRGMLLAGDSKARSTVLISAGNIEDSAAAKLTILELTQLVVNREQHDIILGDGNDQNLINLHDLDIVSARHVSLRADQQVEDRHLYLVGADLSGTLFVSAANNHIVQSSGSKTLIANEAAFVAEDGAVILTRTEFNRVGAQTAGTVDVSVNVGDLATRVDRTVFDAIMTKLNGTNRPTDLGDDTLEDADSSNDDLRPVRVAGTGDDRFLEKQGTGTDYSLILGENRGDLFIGYVRDDASRVQDSSEPGLKGDQAGIEVSSGNAYLVTTKDGDSDNGSLRFSAAGVPTSNVVIVNISGGTFTAVAAGALIIDANTALVSNTGVVMHIGPQNAFDGRLEGFEDKAGPQVLITPPDKEPESPTSGIVYLKDKTQRIEIEIGVEGETGFLADVLWADAVGKLSPRTPANDISNVVGARIYQPERNNTGVEIADTLSAGLKSFEKPFSLIDLLAGGRNANYPYLPTEIRVFNDPGINLFESGNAAGLRNLNRSIVAMGTPAVRMDNFILAITSGEGPNSEAQPSPQQVVTYVAMPTQVTPLENQVAFQPTQYSDSGTVAAYEIEQVEYGVAVNSKLDPEKTYKWAKGTKGDWKSEIQKEVRTDDKYEVAEYLIRVERFDGTFEEIPFVKESESGAAEPNQGSRSETTETNSRSAAAQATEIWNQAWQNWRTESESETNVAPQEAEARRTDSVSTVRQSDAELNAVGAQADGPESVDSRQGFAAQSLVGGAMIIAKYRDRAAKNWRAPWVQHLMRDARFTATQRSRRKLRKRTG